LAPFAARRRCSRTALHGDAAQARVDPDEQQAHSAGDQVREGGTGERLQFGPGEADTAGARVPFLPQRIVLLFVITRLSDWRNSQVKI
jgi:hypothetical protein